MRKFVPLDPESNVSEQHWAVVYVPRRSRNRFAASCVELFKDKKEMLTHSAPAKRKFAASVIGPSKSSEGQSIYYLIQWIGPQP